MQFFSKNIWTLFYIIVILSLFLLSIVLTVLWRQHQSSFVAKQETFLRTSSFYIENLLTQYETTLDMIGESFLEDQKSKKEQQILLDKLIKINPTLAGFGIIGINGEPIVTTSNIDRVRVGNLFKNRYTGKDFLKALQSHQMVVGRTYYIDFLDSLIIPIRKAIRDKNGDVVYVVASAILLNKKSHLIQLFFDANNIYLFRDEDGFIQLYDDNRSNYEKPLPYTHMRSVITKIEKKYRKSLDAIKQDGSVVTVRYFSIVQNEEVINSFHYIKRFRLWAIASAPYERVSQAYVKEALILSGIYLAVMLFIFYLFRVIAFSEEKKKQMLQEQSMRDYLTGLYNRFYISYMCKEEHIRSNTIMFIDLDHFKSINDVYGHEYGDKLLRLAAKRLKNFCEPSGRIVIRYSSDEFIVIFERLDTQNTNRYAAQLLALLSKEYIVGEYKFLIGASIGIASLPVDGKNFDEVKRHADLALYEAKKVKNSFVIFKDELRDRYIKESRIEQELKLAIAKKEIYMLYQPQVDTLGNIVGIEALVRWESAEFGFIPPNLFIRIAETNGYIRELGEFIIASVFEDMQSIGASAQSITFSINISPKQFMQKEFIERLFAQIERYEIDTHRLVLEITESFFIDDFEYVISLLERLRERNIAISLDDFGTGYSSLSLLKRLPIEELKIDKSFVDDIEHSKSSKKLIKSIITIAKNLDFRIIAEGVETKEQYEILRKYECNVLQGYLFSRPITKEELIERLQSDSSDKAIGDFII